jgi:hypothetical protein
MSEIQLNSRWRVVLSDFDPPQWLLQRGDKGGWKSMSFCQTRIALQTAINEKIVRAGAFYPGAHSMPVDQSALDAVASLPALAQRAVPTHSQGMDSLEGSDPTDCADIMELKSS